MPKIGILVLLTTDTCCFKAFSCGHRIFCWLVGWFLQHLCLPLLQSNTYFLGRTYFVWLVRGWPGHPTCEATALVLEWAQDSSQAKQGTSWSSAAGALRKDGLFPQGSWDCVSYSWCRPKSLAVWRKLCVKQGQYTEEDRREAKRERGALTTLSEAQDLAWPAVS